MVCSSYMIIRVALVDTLVTSEESTNKIVSCAACQVASSFNGWECDVKCNVAPDGTLIYGSVDAISVTLSANPTDYHPIVAHEIFKFDVVTVNIRDGYNAETGKFTASIRGLYTCTLYTFSTTAHSKLNIVKKPTDGSAWYYICAAHVHVQDTAPASCGAYVELTTGDELYALGQENSQAYSPNSTPYMPFVTFQCHLIYKAEVLN